MSKLSASITTVDGSTIKLMNPLGKNMAVSASTAEGGEISSNLYVGFKQPSRSKSANPYQIQFKRRYIYTSANQKKYGATYTKAWGKASWMNAIKFAGAAFGATTSADTWNAHNRSVSTTTTYRSILNLKGTKIAKGYQGVEYQFRVRKFNKAKGTHSKWATSQTLTIMKRVTLIDETLHASEDGGLYFDCNAMLYGIGGVFCIDSVLDGNGTELLLQPVQSAFSIDANREESSVPPKKSGYDACEVLLPGESLLRAPVRGEELTLTAYFLAENGSKTYWCGKNPAKQQVSFQDTELDPPRLEVTKDSAIGAVTVNVFKSDETDAITGFGATAAYVPDGGGEQALASIWRLGSLEEMTESNPRTSIFLPPLNSKVIYRATFRSSYGTRETASSEVATYLPSDNLIYLNSTSDVSRCATLYGNPEIVEDQQLAVEAVSVQGRTDPFAVFGKGRERSITLNGTLFKSEDPSLRNATREAWERVAESPETYRLRLPDGRFFKKVAVRSVNMEQQTEDLTSISVDMVVVS